ncbi:alkaline phosphatase family protein, partial [bacterium]|nr:alkaline phosphatase family protein [bacterium]
MQGILPGAVLLTVVLGMPAMASPRLVVVISVDQMRADYLDRFAPALTGGLKFLSEKSVRYKNAHHRHALTQTAPGHLTILSGRHPGPAGVPANEFYDPTQRRIIYCVEDTQAVQLNGARPGMSFRRVDATTIGDWLKDASPKSQVYSVAGKDRSAILMGGRRPDGVYWYDRDSGDFMTSDYYADTFPVFIQAFNAAKWPDRFYGQAWTRIEPETLYERLAGPDDHPGEAAWGEEEAPVFPHWLKTASGLPDGEFYRAFYQTPFIDEYVLELAREIIRQNKLGRDRHVDLLAISLSATDPIGHGFGPNSHEVMDSILRIDRHLGRFLDFLEKEISLKETLIVLTSDHGVLPLIEWLSNRNISAERAGRRVREFQKRVATEVRNKYGPPSKLFLFQGREVYYLDRPYLAA